MQAGGGPREQVPGEHPLAFSASAFKRVAALSRAYIEAAARLRSGDDYPDFFVEGSGPPWHERWPEVIRPGIETFSDDRMTFVDRLAMDDYPDFFVEGSGPPWHERWPEVVRGEMFDANNIQQRVQALGRLNVMQAFLRMRGEAAPPR